MKHILIHLTYECSKDYIFKKVYEILRDEYHSFWENCIFIDGKSINVRGCYYEDFKIHFVYNMDIIGVVPIKVYELENTFDSTISELVSNLVKDCEYYGIFSKDEVNYIEHDIKRIKEVWCKMFNNKILQLPFITKVLSSDPATIVFWKDGTKTVVKCQEGDTYDLEKGILYAIIRKVYGEGRNYTDILNIIDESCETYDHKKANEIFWNYGKEKIDE